MSEVIVRMVYEKVNLLELTGQVPSYSQMRTWGAVDAYCSISAKPGKYSNSKGYTKTVNQSGFISTPEIKMEKKDNTVRIVFFGGSSTAGTGYILADKETWPVKVIDRLKTEFPSTQFDFINAALGGYSTFDSYGRYWSRILPFNPDIVIFNHAWNDMYYFDFVDQIDLWKSELGEWTFSEKKKYATYPPFKIDKFIAWSQLLSKLRIKYQILKQNKNGEITYRAPDPLKSSFNQEGLTVFERNLKLIKSTSEDLDIRFFICKQPTLIIAGLSEEDRKKCGYDLHGFDHNAHVDAFNKMYQIIDNNFLPEEIIDLSSMSGKATYFYDHIHPTSLGTDQYADIVSHSLSKYIRSNYHQEN